MIRSAAILLWISLQMLAAPVMVAQTRPARSSAKSLPAPPEDQVAGAMAKVSTVQLRADIEKLAGFGTRHTLSAGDAEAIRTGRGIGAAREWIRSEFERYSRSCGGCLEVKLDSFLQQPAPRIPQPTTIVNVYAVLRGTEGENAGPIYMISGHYDSRATRADDAQSLAPGANDDGSGIAVVLEAARILSQYKFPATIMLVAFAGEEEGRYGSRHFAEMAKDQGWDIQAVLNNDIVGGDPSRGQNPKLLRVFSEGIPVAAGETELRMLRSIGAENDSSSRQLARYVSQIGQQYRQGLFAPQMVFRPDRYLRGGDQTSFNQQGFAAVRLTEYRENFDHQHQDVRTEGGVQYGDLVKFVDFDYLAKVARLNIATIASLAWAPAPPVNVKLLTKELTNESTLTWSPSPGGRATGYEVVWRDTTRPDWGPGENVGNVTQSPQRANTGSSGAPCRRR